MSILAVDTRVLSNSGVADDRASEDPHWNWISCHGVSEPFAIYWHLSHSSNFFDGRPDGKNAAIGRNGL